MNYLETLNEKQKEAVLYTDGPLLIVAGAGAGKTKTITNRIIHLIHKGIDPSSVLAITFTNKAAKEMRERTLSMLENKENGFEFADLHSNIPFISECFTREMNEIVLECKGEIEAFFQDKIQTMGLQSIQENPVLIEDKTNEESK